MQFNAFWVRHICSCMFRCELLQEEANCIKHSVHARGASNQSLSVTQFDLRK